MLLLCYYSVPRTLKFMVKHFHALSPQPCILETLWSNCWGTLGGLPLPSDHPLPRWALWFSKNDQSRAWRDNLHLVTKFDTVEDFWA